jgi:pimeloyl-ACP methyl ester carboxylesterase
MGAQINGTTLDYELTGDGEEAPWVLMHGVGMNRHVWDEVAPWLGRHGRVVAMDLRSFGQSSKPPRPDAIYTLEDHITDLRGLIHQLAFGRVRLMGLSVGGTIAQRCLRSPGVGRCASPGGYELGLHRGRPAASAPMGGADRARGHSGVTQPKTLSRVRCWLVFGMRRLWPRFAQPCRSLGCRVKQVSS